MCGIAGFVDKNSLKQNWNNNLNQMLLAIENRGPDAQGVWHSLQDKICFGHTRLSIIDISDSGSQPMQSTCGRWVITFNGEIYNFKELKKLLNSNFQITWKGTSDTEVLLNLINFYGLQK